MVKSESFHILISLIEIWTPNDDLSDTSRNENNVIRITEVGNVEIEESYKDLIERAVVSFPKGTIVHKTVTEVEAKGNSKYDIKVNVEDNGIVTTVRANTKVASTKTFQIGDRIRIYLGYTQDPEIANSAKLCNIRKSNSIFGGKNRTENLNRYLEAFGKNPAFDGYITKISNDLPLELECEGLASHLKEISCPKATLKGDGALYNLIYNADGTISAPFKKAGLKIWQSADTLKKFQVGTLELDPDLSLADFLMALAQYNIYAFTKTENNSAFLIFGREYFSDVDCEESLINVDKDGPTPIFFDYHVANNGLKGMNSDPKYLAIKATGYDKDKRSIHLTVTYDPTYDPLSDDTEGEARYRVVNQSTEKKEQASVISKKRVSRSSMFSQQNGDTTTTFSNRVGADGTITRTVSRRNKKTGRGYSYSVSHNPKTNARSSRKTYTNSKSWGPKGHKSRRSDSYTIISSTKPRKQRKRVQKKLKDKLNMDLYTVYQFASRKNPVTLKELQEEAIAYFEHFNTNGVDGSLTVFGGLNIHTTDQVELIDDRYPQKNGTYLVSNVKTTFGTDGFRQTLSLPYCINRTSEDYDDEYDEDEEEETGDYLDDTYNGNANNDLLIG